MATSRRMPDIIDDLIVFKEPFILVFNCLICRLLAVWWIAYRILSAQADTVGKPRTPNGVMDDCGIIIILKVALSARFAR